MRIFIIVLGLSAVLCAGPSYARPVSYPGGWMAMTMNDNNSNALVLHYTPAPDYSVGVMHEYMRGPKAHMDAVQLNILLKRWNERASQANIYLQSGAGIAYDKNDADPAVFTGLSADWENRRFFVMAENRLLHAGNVDRFVEGKARVGIAPYLGNSGDIHTWVMLEGGYRPTNDNNATLTPLVRVFKGSSLMEAGYNLQDKTLLFNLMHTF